MTTKPLEFTVQGVLVDEDEQGQIVGRVILDPVTYVGTSIRQHLAGYLADVDRLCAERSAEQAAASPNRAQRRQAKGRKR